MKTRGSRTDSWCLTQATPILESLSSWTKAKVTLFAMMKVVVAVENSAQFLGHGYRPIQGNKESVCKFSEPIRWLWRHGDASCLSQMLHAWNTAFIPKSESPADCVPATETSAGEPAYEYTCLSDMLNSKLLCSYFHPYVWCKVTSNFEVSEYTLILYGDQLQRKLLIQLSGHD